MTVQPTPRSLSTLNGQWLMRLAWLVLAALSFSLILAALIYRLGRPWQFDEADQLVLQQLGLTIGFYNGWYVAQELSIPVIWAILGLVIFWRQPKDRGVLFFSITLLTYPLSGPPTFLALVRDQPLWRWPYLFVSSVGLFASFISFYVFPDGRFVPRWTRWLVPICLVWMLVAKSVKGNWNQTWPAALGDIALLITGAVALAHRYRHTSLSTQRQQIKWVIYALVLTVLGQILSNLFLLSIETLGNQSAFWWVTYNIFGLPLVVVIPQLLIAAAIALSILRYRLWDIDVLINRSLVYGVLTLTIVGLYILIVGGLGNRLQATGPIIPFIATGIVAVIFQPLRDYFQRTVNRLMYGERDDPYGVLSRLGQQLEASMAPESVLPNIVKTIAQTLKLPYAAITLRDVNSDSIAASFGQRPAHILRLPLLHQQELIGHLQVAYRAPDEIFTPAEQRLLADIANQAGLAVHNIRLTADLQRSRERIVTAREEERRRLRRDLHDGLGPQLASLTLKLDAARNLLIRDAESADRLLLELKSQTQVAIADIRRLVYDLRPPALDDLGLIPAIREQAAQLTQANGLQITVEAPPQLPPLPAAVEVAAYRIALEALTNVARHAHAKHCTLAFTIDQGLKLDIQDDGHGLPPDWRAGVGLTSMRERTSELGGTCLIEPVATGGTRILAYLPI